MNNVPQFPGKGGVAQPGKAGPTQAQPAWKTAICPFLTAGEIARKRDNLVVGAGAIEPVKAQACLGPQCMLFIGMKTVDGTDTSGCSVVHQFGQTMNLVTQINGLNTMVSEFIAAAKAGAAAEAAAAAAEGVVPTPPPTDFVPAPIPAPSPLTAAADEATEPSQPE